MSEGLKKKISELEEHTIRSRANCCENADLMFPCIEECDRVFLWKDEIIALLDEAAKQIQEQLNQSIDLLIEVIDKRGAYSQNHLQHAENVIENASERASKVTEKLKEVLAILDGKEKARA